MEGMLAEDLSGRPDEALEGLGSDKSIGCSSSKTWGGDDLIFLFATQDLCERHEKGVLHKHQRALHKYSMMKKQMMSATVQNKEPESVEQLESRIVEVR